MVYWILASFALSSLNLWANPYPDPKKVISPDNFQVSLLHPIQIQPTAGENVLRVEVGWQNTEKYTLSGLFLEKSGTAALLKSAQKPDLLGSYKAELIVNDSQKFYSSIGTGKEFRRLVRTLSFRFPFLQEATKLRLIVRAENPENGKLDVVLDQDITTENIKPVTEQNVKVTLLRKALKEPILYFNFYAEGFLEGSESKFLTAAEKAVSTFEKNLPGSEHFEFKAVFSSSKIKLGSAQDFGDEIKLRDSFLGLYFPHWSKFSRWYHVVYPTSETKYRNALAQVAYDYPLAIVDDGAYWGVGNYKELTAIPSNNSQFSYLLLHEFGHFMGLNEEYEGGGPTELEFAPGMHEPWSQNITFNPTDLKWKNLIEPGISVPTSFSEYTRFGGRSKNPVGAYPGGYADSKPRGKSHKPVMNCTMSAGGGFCKVCQNAILKVINHDLAE